jgi:hypothetical protein
VVVVVVVVEPIAVVVELPVKFDLGKRGSTEWRNGSCKVAS